MTTAGLEAPSSVWLEGYQALIRGRAENEIIGLYPVPYNTEAGVTKDFLLRAVGAPAAEDGVHQPVSGGGSPAAYAAHRVHVDARQVVVCTFRRNSARWRSSHR